MNDIKDYVLKVTVAFDGGVVQKFTFDNPQDYLTSDQMAKFTNVLPYVYYNKLRLSGFINQSIIKDIENRYDKHIVEVRKVVFTYRR